MADTELRWRQRLESLQRALAQLQAALKTLAADPGNEVIGIAVIKAYEFQLRTQLKDPQGSAEPWRHRCAAAA